jgi:antitoxin component of RelBE/YafQ-DinJ toxin-antitoxin module
MTEERKWVRTYISPHALMVLKTISKQKGIPMYQVLEDAVFTYAKMREQKLIAVDEKTYRELEDISRTLKLPINNVINLLLTAAKVLFSQKLRFYEMIKPIPELVKILKEKEEAESSLKF